MSVRKKNEKVIRFCRNCVHSTPDMRFENLSLDGKPTLLSCPERKWRMVICTTDVCERYDDGVRPEAAVGASGTSVTNSDNWLDW
jgi:hypothetical protein